MRRVVLVCPGRGSYTRELLGTLRPSNAVSVADALRRDLGRPGPTALDAAPAYSTRLHVAGENASILTSAYTLGDAEAQANVEVVAVVGNSMGWYSALGVAGALSVPDTFRLVETMGGYQAENVIGGQLLYTLVGEDWRRLASPEVEAALRETPELYLSIRLGGQVVLGGTETALKSAMAQLPPRPIGERTAPMLLPLHSAFHTPLLASASERGRRDLAGLGWSAPRLPLVDGRGHLFRPFSADPAAIAAYTLGHQVTEPYDFTSGLRVALAEYAPDAVVLLGPGGNLGGPVAQTMIEMGWQGLANKTDFLARQAVNPLVIALNRPEQRALVTA